MLSLAKQNELKDEILKERLDDILPPLMLECGIDASAVSCPDAFKVCDSPADDHSGIGDERWKS